MIKKPNNKQHKNKKPHIIWGFGWCDRDRIRTYDRLLRRQMLYPAELRDLYNFFKNYVFEF